MTNVHTPLANQPTTSVALEPDLVRAEHLVAELRQLGIIVWADHGRLHFKAPEGGLTPRLRQCLADEKPHLLKLLSGPDHAASTIPLPPIAARPADEEAQLSYSQERLWFLDQLLPDRPTYNMAYAYRLRGALDIEALRQALCWIIRRHEVLRTGIVAIDGAPHARIDGDIALALPVTDLTGYAVSERESRARALATAEARFPFKLDCAPPLRGRLLRLETEEHWLVLCLHHVANDDWSFDILWNELDVCYDAIRNGIEPRLPELSIRYADFAAWQREQLDAGRLDDQLAYWKRQLVGPLPRLGLHTDHPRVAEKAYRGDVRLFTVPDHVSAALRRLAQECNATLFMVLASAFKTLLNRYTGCEDVVIGTAIAGRGAHDVERLIGFFVNNLVLRTSLSGNPRFRELVARVREVALAGYANQDVPFERVIDALRPERDPSRTPLFDVLLVLHRSRSRRKLGALRVEQLHVTTGSAKFDLTLEIDEAADGRLSGFFEFDTDLHEPETIDRLASHLLALLEGVAASPDARLSELPLLSDAERHRLLVEWNDTAVEYQRDLPLNGLFEAQVDRAPTRTAVTAGAAAYTYAELDARANRIAQALRARGVGRGQRIGLCVERGADMLSAMLGILKAGAAYVPLDPAFPGERLRFMAEDAQLALIVSTSILAEPFAIPRERQLLLDADAASIAASPDARLSRDANAAQPEDPAYVIYTSGSTGRPKGVVVPHRAGVNFLTSMAREPGLEPEDVLVAVTTLSFDIALLELLLPLTLGACVVIAARDDTLNGESLASLLKERRATVMQATPVTWRLLLEAGWKGGSGFKALVGGEALPKDLADQLLACGVELWNMYGPTETTVWSTCGRITGTSRGISIGRPIANTTVRILDARRSACPIGVPGEICIGGAGVTLGYWNRPELTAERFIPDPFDTAPGATLYRTGDRGCWRNDATLEHLGRLDEQVKVRGFRIELGEIEAVLAEHAEVRKVAVYVWEAGAGDARIVACCVPATEGRVASIELRKYLRAKLPEYMIPQHFLPVSEIPLTPNGKVDRGRLPRPVVLEANVQQYAAPSDPVETVIAEVWTRLIRPSRPIGQTDKFFEMGGHSLLGMQALIQMEQRLGVKVSFLTLFQENLADLAKRCRSELAIRNS